MKLEKWKYENIEEMFLSLLECLMSFGKKWVISLRFDHNIITRKVIGARLILELQKFMDFSSWILVGRGFQGEEEERKLFVIKMNY